MNLLSPAPDTLSLEIFGLRDWRPIVELTLMEESIRTCKKIIQERSFEKVEKYSQDHLPPH